MKIAVVNWNDRLVGGAETYLAAVLPALEAQGVEIAFWSEQSSPSERPKVFTARSQHWSAAELGRSAAIEALRDWKPDLLYSHGVTDPKVEEELLSVAPAVAYIHGYYGTCITGSKTNHRPQVLPCDRAFGPSCLVHFYPKQCGGRSPLTLLRNYKLQSRRLRLMAGYRAILCASNHMRNELLRQGLHGSRVRLAPYPIESSPEAEGEVAITHSPRPGEPWRILFAGRLEAQKGVNLLLDSLPMVRASVNRPLELLVAGDGRERQALEKRASALTASDGHLKIGFTGWLEKRTLSELMKNVHLLAFPSIWPEPFGIIGVEAAHLGVPAVAFDVGGVSDWLIHGETGMLAPADPPTAEKFAQAVTASLHPSVYQGLTSAAVLSARRFSMQAHLERFWEAVADVGIGHAADFAEQRT